MSVYGLRSIQSNPMTYFLAGLDDLACHPFSTTSVLLPLCFRACATIAQLDLSSAPLRIYLRRELELLLSNHLPQRQAYEALLDTYLIGHCLRTLTCPLNLHICAGS